MNIEPLSIEQDGPGVDLTNHAVGITIQMADPVSDLAYARNGVTLTYDLSGAGAASLCFEAKEFGDEPHYPKDALGMENSENAVGFGPVAGFDFDGVAVSVDGVDWYEIQDLRSLRSNRFTAYSSDSAHLIRRKAPGHSEGLRPPVPIEGGHGFRAKRATHSEGWGLFVGA